jgi:hypothetical protein
MRRSRIAMLVAVLLTFASAVATAQMGAIGAPTPGTTGIRVLAPTSGQKFNSNIVPLRFELTNPRAVAATSPTFRVQIDNTDPVLTTSTDYTFTGLAPGAHKIAVELVDANQTPVAGTQTVVPITVAAPAAATPAGNAQGTQAQPQSTPQSRPPEVEQPQAPEPQSTASNYVPAGLSDPDPIPNSGSALPLLSVIGFGVLVGGIATAMRTR